MQPTGSDAIAESVHADSSVPAAPLLHSGPAVYFVQARAGGPIKIGVAADLEQRLRGLQSMCPIPLVCLAAMPGYTAQEQELHRYFAHIRLHGEWFEDTPELRSFIGTLTEAEPLPIPLEERRSHDARWRKYIRVRSRIRTMEIASQQRQAAHRAEMEETGKALRAARAEMAELRKQAKREKRELEVLWQSWHRRHDRCQDCDWPLASEDGTCGQCDYCQVCGTRLPNRDHTVCGDCRRGHLAVESYTARLVSALGYVAPRFKSKEVEKLCGKAGKAIRKRRPHPRVVEALRLAAECLEAMGLADLADEEFFRMERRHRAMEEQRGADGE